MSKFSIKRKDKLQPDGSPGPLLGSTTDSFRKPLSCEKDSSSLKKKDDSFDDTAEPFLLF